MVTLAQAALPLRPVLLPITAKRQATQEYTCLQAQADVVVLSSLQIEPMQIVRIEFIWLL